MKLHSKPIRFLITRLARAYGFMDPIAVLGRLRAFSQKSEVGEPIELLRAGMLFHARGLVNTKAIQHNLDWVWPYWVERQFNPDDPSFIPRAFSFSHINLTHRNWTAVAQPDVPFYPIVDPRGLVTPLYNAWSLDFWFVPQSGPVLFPSKLPFFEQRLVSENGLRVISRVSMDSVDFTAKTSLVVEGDGAACLVEVNAPHLPPGHLALALRPYNPEGVSSINRVEVLPEIRGWRIDHRHEVWFDRHPARHLFSSYQDGDVSLQLHEPATRTAVDCPAGMATAAALFSSEELAAGPLTIRTPIYDELKPTKRAKVTAALKTDQLARLELPDARLQNLFDLAQACVVAHCPAEVYPGPYTYKRFWFRDAVFILNALLSLGGIERVRRALAQFAPRQRRDGYFLSQEGEWDSNGEALWFYAKFAAVTGEPLPWAWRQAMTKGARWIRRKRLPRGSGRPEAGLLPAGFSAEHLGPNDFYYWDDFWAVAGLRAAGEVQRDIDRIAAEDYFAEANEFLSTIENSVPRGPQRRFPGAIPASPYRRMDSGAIGSIVADYPLQLFPAGDSRILRTADFLQTHCFRQGAFMQDMIHSGLNIYLTLHLAQVWLRAGQPQRVWPILQRVADLASPTGQWPEAIHPRTGGGCMGDGQHIWAAAEWLMMLRNLCVREEGDRLVLGAGIARDWLATGPVKLSETHTPHGRVSVAFSATPGGVRVQLEAQWHRRAPALEFDVPGCTPLFVSAGNERNDYLLPHSA